LKADIFKIFPGLTLTYDNKGLLKELTVFFQDFFARLHNAKAFGGESIDRKPILRKLLAEILAHMNRIDTPMLNQYKINIQSLEQFKFLFDISAIATQNADSVQLGMYKQDEYRRFTPLVVLAIKMIQLLAAEFYGKYGSLIRRCGLSSAPKPVDIMTGKTQMEAGAEQAAEAAQAARMKKLFDEEELRKASRQAAEEQAARAAATIRQFTAEQQVQIAKDTRLLDDIESIYKSWTRSKMTTKCNDVYNKIYHLRFSNSYSKLDPELNERLQEIIKDLRTNPSTNCNQQQKAVLYELSVWLNPPEPSKKKKENLFQQTRY
jgi:outer membrane protein OmpA-like peptidoglycan-associated protein